MTEPAKRDELDVERLRRQVADIGEARTASAEPAPELNAFARQIAEHYRDSSYSPALLIGQFRLLEFVLCFTLGLLVNWVAGVLAAHVIYATLAIAIGSALTIISLQVADAYQIPSLRAAARSSRSVLTAWSFGFAAMIFQLVLVQPHLGLWASLGWYLFGGGMLLLVRQFIAFGIRNWARDGTMERRAVIVGGGAPAKELVRALEGQSDNDIRICGIFDDRGSARSPDVVAGYPKLGTFAELVEFARLARIDMLIIALPASAEQRILQLLKKLWVLPVDIRLAAHSTRLRFRPRAYSHVGAVPMLDIFDKPIRDWDSVAKRIFDIVFSVLALAVFWPVMIAAAIAVKATSKGPVLFVQKRHGFNNEIINVLKFRSMYTEQSDPTAKKAVTKNDPRVTPVGRFLRKSSLDELPQLFNVLKGDLSLVGPRPHAVHAQTGERKYVDVVESYFARHRVKPGVTGWAQINGLRGELDSDEKIRKRTAYDLDYIENWSLLLDLKILFLTPIRLLNTENAY
ncbi:undecaprenyl-phosphate glucose phosphotransferase [Rhizobium oryzicola]|uniref:Undecaprenyl-phosphate glucose phosphotransferase n=1 Tax=Rhizobium oryzicola TaxID=1232668 RepID=A0ABT8STP4_9HYPH|nr:undecaprenyl-phosphate glucose phosphotransferase [Rhizobium oryzicola]MDO1581787.1 undecaprenyl-phosphate glucose phosphotransferase [Rhizobium oryzicola]